MKLSKTNPNTIDLIESLTKQSSAEDAPIWKAVANELKRANGKNKEVNVFNLRFDLDLTIYCRYSFKKAFLYHSKWPSNMAARISSVKRIIKRKLCMVAKRKYS